MLVSVNLTINNIIVEMYIAQIRGNYSIKLEHIPGKITKMQIYYHVEVTYNTGHKTHGHNTYNPKFP